jgi:hypothetical protein
MVVNIMVPNPETRDPYMKGIGGILNGVQRPTPLGKNDPYGPRIQGPMANQFRQFLPDTSDGLGRFRPIANKHNDYYLDRELQMSMGTWSGVPVIAQDPMAQESIGNIYDRRKERLGVTDAMIIRSRRWLLNACKSFQEDGTVPPGVEKPALYNMYSGGAIVPEGVNALDDCADLLYGRKPIEIPVPI